MASAADPQGVKAREASPTLRLDYKPPPYFIDQVSLDFDLGNDVTTVASKLHVVPNYPTGTPPPTLKLDGASDVVLESIKVSGTDWPVGQYAVDPMGLAIEGLQPGEFELEISVKIKPQDNTLLEGLYLTNGTFCSQCEAEGFRHITYFLDRPDVMSKYHVRIESSKEKYPVLLSNGNLVETGDLADGRHFTVWDDPFPKPCYLFALVAGDLAKLEDSHTTASGRKVDLRIFAQVHNMHKVGFAMQALKQAMKWDEDTFGLEYDLDLFNIVAIDDFNMGAMENKSLNIFNSVCILASVDTETDGNFFTIQEVVGHEYFHNWTGDRVTCRDWFQLTLKEGLTVHREREFAADMNSRAVKRIKDADLVRSDQFPEDAGPMAHCVRPESYIKIDNFYTSTIYEKGAEVIRMYQTILGKAGFRKGMDLYFQRHDGHAVTCDDFLAAMADANGKDLTSFAKWYSQAGTPVVTVTPCYNKADKTLTLKMKQVVPPTPGQPTKEPMLIPVSVGLLSADGSDLPLKLQGTTASLGTTAVLELDTEEASFVFEDVPSPPVPSVLREFSAPVKLTVEGQTDDDLFFLFANDSDAFNRWEAGQILFKNLVLKLYNAGKAAGVGEGLEGALQEAGSVPDRLVAAVRSILNDPRIDGQFAALATSLPSESELKEDIPETDPVLLHEVCSYVERELARKLRADLEAIVSSNDAKPGEPYVIDAEHASRRRIKNHALWMLAGLQEDQYTTDCLKRFREASNMTDTIGALAGLIDTMCPEREAAMAEFYEKWKADTLVTLKWLSLTARSNAPGNIATMEKMLEHPAYCITTPNCNYSLLRAFAVSAVNFHAADGSGYRFLADALIKVDKVNHQVAARIVQSAFTSWKQYDPMRQQLMRSELEKMMNTEGLSPNTMEVVSKSLQA